MMNQPLHNLFKAINDPQFEIYQDVTANPKQRFRWRIKVSGNIVRASTEGYETRSGALENVKKLEDHIRKLREYGKLV